MKPNTIICEQCKHFELAPAATLYQTYLRARMICHLTDGTTLAHDIAIQHNLRGPFVVCDNFFLPPDCPFVLEHAIA